MATPQASRFSQYMRRTHSLKEAFVPDLMDQIQPTHELSNPFDPSNFRLREERLWGCTGTSAAIVGQASSVILQTPPGTICVINRILVVSSSVLLAAWTSNSQSNPRPVNSLDARVVGIPKREAVLVDDSTTVAAVTTANSFYRWAAGTNEEKDLLFVLSGDPFSTASGGPFTNRFILQTTALNASFDYAINGWVRPSEPSEGF